MVVLAIREKDDASDRVPVPAAGEHLGSHTETSSHVRAALGDKGLHCWIIQAQLAPTFTPAIDRKSGLDLSQVECVC